MLNAAIAAALFNLIYDYLLSQRVKWYSMLPWVDLMNHLGTVEARSACASALAGSTRADVPCSGAACRQACLADDLWTVRSTSTHEQAALLGSVDVTVTALRWFCRCCSLPCHALLLPGFIGALLSTAARPFCTSFVGATASETS